MSPGVVSGYWTYVFYCNLTSAISDGQNQTWNGLKCKKHCQAYNVPDRSYPLPWLRACRPRLQPVRLDLTLTQPRTASKKGTWGCRLARSGGLVNH